MKKMELSGTIPLTELPAENKVLNGHTGGAFQSTSTLLLTTKRPTVNFASVSGSDSHSERALQHNTILLVQNCT
jgi:hypothetical protein